MNHSILTPTKRILIFIFAVFITSQSCKTNSVDPNPPTDPTNSADSYSAEVATKWAELHLKLVRTTAGYTPPVASRSYGYAGLTLYETVVGGMPNNQSLAGQLSQLTTLPKPDASVQYNWALSANAGQASILRSLFPTTSDANKKTIDSLEAALETSFKDKSSSDIIDKSKKLGADIATAIFEWSKTDGGHEGYTRNFPATYQVPVFPGSWQPTENGQKIPMQPTWGKNRTFAPANANINSPAPIAYSTEITSQYFAQYLEVYTKNKALTADEKEIAVWWADNPGETFTPPGHSYYIAGVAVKTAKVGLGKAAETFARTGIAVTDAFIQCWKVKYIYNNERPYTYVRYAIDPNWKPFWAAPPFPGYMSGHATQSSASAVVLADLYGDNFTFTDDSHVGRKDKATGIELKNARTFKSFSDCADESAMSRFLGGIHTRQDNEIGLKEGKTVGRNINALKFKK